MRIPSHMASWVAFLGLILVGVVWLIQSSRSATAEGQATNPDVVACAITLGDVVSGRAQIVDLAYTLNAKTPHWPGDNYQPFQLTTIATLEKNGVLSKMITTSEHLGTHIDAPNHFETKQPSVDAIPPEQLFAPGVVIDAILQSERSADYVLQPADIEAWEKVNGRIPEGAVVFLHTGWGRFWDNYDRFKNQEVGGAMHFPGYSPDAARILVTERKVRGLGIDTLSIDTGTSRDFQVHHIVNAAGKYGLENVANLGKLPARGFFVVVAPIKVESGSGGPTRIFAIVPKKT